LRFLGKGFRSGAGCRRGYNPPTFTPPSFVRHVIHSTLNRPMAATSPIDVTICGTCVADVLVRPVPLERPVGGGRLIHVDPIEVTTGGIVCNTGIAMRRLGLRVAASSLVGADLWGDLVRSRLDAEGIDLAGLETHATCATSTTAALIDPSGERSFAHHVGAPSAIDRSFVHRQRGLWGRGRLVLVGYFGLLPGLEPDLAEALAEIRAAGCTVALETGGSGGTFDSLAAALPLVDCYVPSLDEAIHQTGLHDPRAIVERYRAAGCPGVVGVKLGTRGTLLSAAPSASEMLEIPCVPAPGPVADTTGAGDAFLAGLLTGLVTGMPPAQAGRLGSAAAACCVTGVGATAGLRSLEDTLALVDGQPA
jgi:sugar/nucleoside kinase (ribokinase family)